VAIGRLNKNENLKVDIDEFQPQEKNDFVLILKKNLVPAAF
jgi:hypothetical protein